MSSTAEEIITPSMREFNVSNDLLFDQAALSTAWERDGYWFFRNVLDHGAVGWLRNTYIDTLKAAGVIDRHEIRSEFP